MWPFKKKKWGELGEEMSSHKVKQILINGLGIDDIRLKDQKYRAIPKSDFESLAWAGRENFSEYESEINDCDDMALHYESDTRRQWARKAKGSACALAFGRAKVKRGTGTHMMIWQVDNKGHINWYEGQNYSQVDEPEKVYIIEG